MNGFRHSVATNVVSCCYMKADRALAKLSTLALENRRRGLASHERFDIARCGEETSLAVHSEPAMDFRRCCIIPR